MAQPSLICQCGTWYEKNADGKVQCPACGRYRNPEDDPLWFRKNEADRRRALQAAKRKAQPQQGAYADLAELERYCTKLAAQVLADYDIDYAWIRAKRRRNSIHQMRNGKSTITYGYESMRNAFQRGLREYKTVAQRLGIPRYLPPGWASIHHLTLHEAAHALQRTVPNGRTRGSVHNEVFCAKYAELLRKYDREEWMRRLGIDESAVPEPEVRTAPHQPELPRTAATPTPKKGDVVVKRFRIKDTKQFWAWRLQKDGRINITIGQRYWSKLNDADRAWLYKYILATAQEKLLGQPLPPEMHQQHEQIKNAVVKRVYA
jgi:uncharacterized Zn finger protein (UPF0148 family)